MVLSAGDAKRVQAAIEKTVQQLHQRIAAGRGSGLEVSFESISGGSEPDYSQMEQQAPAPVSPVPPPGKESLSVAPAVETKKEAAAEAKETDADDDEMDCKSEAARSSRESAPDEVAAGEEKPTKQTRGGTGKLGTASHSSEEVNSAGSEG